MKKKKKIIAFIIGILVVATLALPLASMGIERASKKTVNIKKGVDLKTAPECEIVGKEDLTVAFSTVVDDTGKDYFCLDLWLRYPQGNGENYIISDDSEVTSDSVRWLVHNYNTYNPKYFEGVHPLTAYGATQLAIWHYTDNFTQLESSNPLVSQLVNDAANVSFPSVKTTLGNYSANVVVDDENMILEDGSYVGYFTVNLVEPAVNNLQVYVQDYQIKIFNGNIDITDDPNVSLLEVSENRYKLTIHDDLLDEIDEISVRYQATIIGEGDAVLSGRPVEGNRQSVSSFDKVTFSDQVEARGQFVVKELGDVIFVSKIDQHGNVLPGAEFTLTDNEGNVEIGTTDVSGEVKFDIVAGKVYTLEETKNPYGYTGTFKQEGITLQNSGEVFFYTVENQLNKGNITVTKIDQDGKPLKNAEFTLTDEFGNTTTGITGIDGLLNFEIEINKTYTLEETKNPYGYTGTFKQEGITLENDGEVFSYTVENKLEQGSISVKKVDQDGHPLSGAEFTLTDEFGNIKIGVTSEDGLLSFGLESNKTYTLEETKNPYGYTGTFKQEGITLENDGEVFSYTVENKLEQGSISVKKVDQDGHPLSGAEFTLTDEFGNIKTGVTNEDGLLSFGLESNKIYTLEETKNPYGYTGTFKQEGITMEHNNQVFQYTVTNEKNTNIPPNTENTTPPSKGNKRPGENGSTTPDKSPNVGNNNPTVESPPIPEDSSIPTTSPEKSPNTGDYENLNIWITVLLGSSVTLVGIVLFRIKTKNNKHKRK